MFKQLFVSSKRALRAVPIAAALGLGMAATLVSAPAQAWYHGGYYGPRVGVYIGPGYGYYPPAYYYPPAPVVVQQPPVYIEQAPQQAAPAPVQSNSWYYCAGSRSYYPYVKDCPGGWQQVAPRP